MRIELGADKFRFLNQGNLAATDKNLSAVERRRLFSTEPYGACRRMLGQCFTTNATAQMDESAHRKAQCFIRITNGVQDLFRRHCALPGHRPDGVAADPKLSQVTGDGTSEPDDSLLCGSVGAHGIVAKTGSRGQIHNRSAPFYQVRCRVFDSSKIPLQINRDDVVEVPLRHLVNATGTGKPRVVDQKIDSTEAIHGG